MVSSGYLLLIVVTLAIGLGAQWYVNSRLRKYDDVPNSLGLTGADVARQMLAFYGVSDVAIHRGGEGQDFFDPRSNSVTLSPAAYGGRSITAMGYVPMKVRGAIVPAVNLASNAWIFLLMIGIIMNLAGLTMAAIIMYAVVVLFQIVTLPVEFNASRRAMAYMETVGLPQGEQAGAFDVLRACALTYVAAALTSILQLLWLLGQRRD